MSDPGNMTLVYLRRMSQQMDALTQDVREIKTHLAQLDQQTVTLATRLEEIDQRLDRMEKRPGTL